MNNELYKDLYERMRQEYLEMCKDNGRLRKALEEAKNIYETADMETDSADVLDGMYIAVKSALEPTKGEDKRE